MNPTVFHETRRRKILAACEASWDDVTKRDCSGFVKHVLSELGLPDNAAPDSMQANALQDHFRNTKSLWYYMGTGNSAVTQAGVSAHEGNVVLAVWKNPSWTGPQDTGHHGHIAIVTEYFSSRKSPKPTQLLLAYWGMWSEDGSAEGKKNEKMSASFGTAKQSAILYFSYTGDWDS